MHKLQFSGDLTAIARSVLKVSVKPFQRLAPIQRACVGRPPQRAKQLLRRLLFCQAFFFAPLMPKKKADID